jgi:hypothetical protein
MSQKISKQTIALPEQNHTHNLVAKHAFKFNRAQIMSNKKQYARKAKHTNLESFILVFVADSMINGFSA